MLMLVESNLYVHLRQSIQIYARKLSICSLSLFVDVFLKQNKYLYFYRKIYLFHNLCLLFFLLCLNVFFSKDISAYYISKLRKNCLNGAREDFIKTECNEITFCAYKNVIIFFLHTKKKEKKERIIQFLFTLHNK